MGAMGQNDFRKLEPAREVAETALLSEEALAEDWDRPEEDEAWSNLLPRDVDADLRRSDGCRGQS